MKRKIKLSVETFLKLFEIVEDGYSFETALRKLDLNYNSKELRYKYHMYLEHGIDILIPHASRSKYSRKLKEKVAHILFFSCLLDRVQFIFESSCDLSLILSSRGSHDK